MDDETREALTHISNQIAHLSGNIQNAFADLDSKARDIRDDIRDIDIPDPPAAPHYNWHMILGMMTLASFLLASRSDILGGLGLILLVGWAFSWYDNY